MNVQLKLYQQSVGKDMPYFYTLVHPGSPRKNRNCLKCQAPFLSQNFGNRICSICLVSNGRISPKAQQVSK